MDFGSVVLIRRFYDCKLQYADSRKQSDYRSARKAYRIALSCLNSEYKRKSLTDSEYSDALSGLQTAFEEITKIRKGETPYDE